MRISDWSSDVCSADLGAVSSSAWSADSPYGHHSTQQGSNRRYSGSFSARQFPHANRGGAADVSPGHRLCCGARSEEHTSELQSLMRISYAVFGLKKKKATSHNQRYNVHVNTSTTCPIYITIDTTDTSPRPHN